MTRTIGLALIGAALLVAGLVDPAAAQSQVSGVAVFGTEPRVGTEEAGVMVFRGAPSPPPMLSPDIAAAAAALPQAVGGRALWLIDPANDKVIGCSLRSNGQVGGKRIRCGDRSLSRLLAQ